MEVNNYGDNQYIGMIIQKMNYHHISKEIVKVQYYNQM